MSQDNFTVIGTQDVTTTIDSECILAKKIYGRCSQQDCLVPKYSTAVTPTSIVIPESYYVAPSTGVKLWNQYSGSAISTTPLLDGVTGLSNNETILFTNSTAVSKIIASNVSVTITATDPTPAGSLVVSSVLCPYIVTVTYNFTYDITLYDSTGKAINVYLGADAPTSTTPECEYTTLIPAGTTYTKEIILNGGETTTFPVAVYDSEAGTTSVLSTPNVFVQSIQQALAAGVDTNTVTTTGTEPTSTTSYYAGVTIGLFTIIQLYRPVVVCVQTTDAGTIPTCSEINTLDPCETFNQLQFPLDQFNPPTCTTN